MTTVAEVGEFGLIERVTSRLHKGRATVLGPGDDAAVVRTPDGRVVASLDMFVEGRHFRRDYSPGYDVGRKAAAANLADVAAMGATATALLVGLACPPDLPVAWVEELADGLRDEADRVAASVEGGDVVSAPLVCVSVAVLGDLGGLAPVQRSGARPGDLVVVVGAVGASAAGLALLQAGRGEAGPGLVDRHLRPQPPYPAGPLLASAGATAMIDVSDGLLADLGHIADLSGVAVDVETAALQPDQAMSGAGAELGTDPLGWILTGGEDHALVATVPAGWQPPAALEALGVRVVGRCESGAGVTVDGRAYRGDPGWTHFSGS